MKKIKGLNNVFKPFYFLNTLLTSRKTILSSCDKTVASDQRSIFYTLKIEKTIGSIILHNSARKIMLLRVKLKVTSIDVKRF